MDSSLIIGILVLVAGTAYGTYLIQLSNRKANTKRIELLEQTFTNQNESLKKQSKKIEILTKKVDSNVDLVKNISKKTNQITTEVLKTAGNLDKTTTQISDISLNVKELVKQNNELTSSINNQIKEKGTLNLIIPKFKNYNFVVGANAYIIPRSSLERGYQLSSAFSGALGIFLKIEGNKLLILTNVRNREKELMVVINENDWSLNKDLTFSINFDKKGLEIMDKNGYINFQLELTGNKLEFNFVRYLAKGVMVLTNKGTFTIPYKSEGFQSKFHEANTKIQHLFKHSGNDYLGKRL